jgi:hypothetical protein
VTRGTRSRVLESSTSGQSIDPHETPSSPNAQRHDHGPDASRTPTTLERPPERYFAWAAVGGADKLFRMVSQRPQPFGASAASLCACHERASLRLHFQCLPKACVTLLPLFQTVMVGVVVALNCTRQEVARREPVRACQPLILSEV